MLKAEAVKNRHVERQRHNKLHAFLLFVFIGYSFLILLAGLRYRMSARARRNINLAYTGGFNAMKI